MPKGSFKPLAKTAICSGLPLLVIPRKTLTSPALVSATKMSPLGAVRMIRGLSSPVAYCSTLKPAGTLRPCAFRTRHHLGAIAGGSGREWSGKIFDCDLANSPGFS